MSRLAGTLALLFCVLLPRAASAWGPDGHRVVGSIADQMLNPNAKQQIASILGVDLRTAGPWLDCVKSVHRQADGTLAYVEGPPYQPPSTPVHDDPTTQIHSVRRNSVGLV